MSELLDLVGRYAWYRELHRLGELRKMKEENINNHDFIAYTDAIDAIQTGFDVALDSHEGKPGKLSHAIYCWIDTIRANRYSKDTVSLDLKYPGIGENSKYIKIGLEHVRAADDIRVSYDFDRNGYLIEQQSIFQWESGDEICDLGWKEAAFIPAWQFEKKDER